MTHHRRAVSSRRAPSLLLAALLGCGDSDPAPAPTPAPTPTSVAQTSWDGPVVPPQGFTPMDAEGVARLRASTLRGTAKDVDIEGWVTPGGGARGLVVATKVRHEGGDAVAGHTLETWVRHQMRGVEAGLATLERDGEAPKVERDGDAMRIGYAVPLPGSGALRVHGRAWLSADGTLVEAMCQCAGLGCTEPPSCRIPDPPTDARSADTILAGRTQTLATAVGDARVEAAGNLTPLPEDVLAQLATDGAEDAPERTGHHVQGRRSPDGSGVFLTDATWCVDTDPCQAETLAENRRKAEVDSLREGGRLRTVQTRSAPHDERPTFGYEIEQRDGFWTRTTFWNEGTAVREVSCSCAGLACALAQRTCTASPK